MPEVVATFRAADGRHQRADPAAQTRDGWLGDLSQECFEFGEQHLDRVEIRRVLRQILQRCAGSFDGFFDAGNFVCGQIVDHHDVAAPERRCQALFDISYERHSVDRPVEDHWRRHPIVPQGSHERDHLPCSLRNVADQSLATQATPPEPDHIHGEPGLVDKHQSRRIKKALLPSPASTRPRHVRSMLFGRS